MSAATGYSRRRGGLAVALTSALRDCGGLWFGWSGEVTDAFTGQINFKREKNGVTTATVDLEDVNEHQRDVLEPRGLYFTIGSISPNMSATSPVATSERMSGSRTR